MRAHEADYAAATPDYGAAVAHLTQARSQQLRELAAAMGQPATDDMIGQQVLMEARQTAYQALQNGKNPGEVFYAMAKAMGYTAKAAETLTEKTDGAPAKEIEAKIAATEKNIARLAKGQTQAGKAPTGGETGETGELSLEAIGKLDGAAFDAAFAKFSAAQKKAERNLH